MDCIFLSHGLMIEKSSLHDCCYIREMTKGRPLIMPLNQDKTVDWKEFFELKSKQKNEKINSEQACKDCIYLHKDWDLNHEGSYVSVFQIAHWNKCNSNCIYCSPENNSGDKYFNCFELIKSLFEYEGGAYIKDCNHVSFLGGEPTLLPEFEDLISLFVSKNFKIIIHSSGIKFSETIYKYLSSGQLRVVISPDSAFENTYKKIKRVDCFDKVWENLRKYVSVQKNSDNVKVKFIIVPGINDSFEEVDCFLDKVKEIGASYVIWDIEGFYSSKNNYFAPHIQMLLQYAAAKTQEYKMQYEFYSIAQKFLKSLNVIFDEIEDLQKFKSGFYSLKEKYKHNNIQYL